MAHPPQPDQPGAAATPPPVYQSTPRVPLSGLAVTALILGIIATVASFIPVVNFSSYLLGGAAVLFGIVGIATADGKKRRGRGLGIAGLVLGILGAVIATIVIFLVVGTLSALSDSVQIEVDSSQAGGAAGTPQDPLPFGSAVTLENGLAITVGEPRPVRPSKTSSADRKQKYFWAIDITVLNSGADPISLVGAADGFLSSGAACDEFFDSEQFGDSLWDLDGALPPGKEKRGIHLFECPSKGPVDLAFSVDIFSPTLYYSQELPANPLPVP